MKWQRTRRSAGFSLIELIVVIAIIMVVSAMAVPQVLTQINIYGLRSAASAVVGVMQNARMQAVKDNRFYTVRGISAPATLSQANTPGVYVDSIGGGGFGSGDGVYEDGETATALPNNITFDLAGAHPAFNNAAVGGNFAPLPVTAIPSFNSRGLPCVSLGAACQGVAGGGTAQFAYFLRQTGASGVHWAAITVNGAGRMRVWTWTGTTWTAN